MRGALIALMIASFSMPSYANGWLSEPEPVDGIEGNPFRTVEYQPGKVIRLIGARGQPLMVEMPPGWIAERVNVSEQDVMMNTVINPSRDQLRDANAAAENAGVKECNMTPNLEVCTQRDRFFFLKPLTPLDPQPVPVLMLQPVAGKPSREVPVMFRLETAQAGTEPYYGVRVSLPAAAVAMPSQPVPRRAVRPTATLPPTVVTAPPPINDAYRIEGDRALLGEPGR